MSWHSTLSLFVAYKLVLFFAEAEQRKTKNFFHRYQRTKKKRLEMLEEEFSQQIQARSDTKGRVLEHLAPAAVAILAILTMIQVNNKKQAEIIPAIEPPPRAEQIKLPPAQAKIETREIMVLDIEQQQRPGRITAITDERGRTVYTNKALQRPQLTDDIFSTQSKETPVIITNNQILVPVMIGHNGKAIKTFFLLDTGCNITLLHHTVSEIIRPSIIGKTKSIVADGRKVDSQYCKIDFIQVGPYRDENFTATTLRVAGSPNFHGLLGMEFLRKFPHVIDLENKVIRWL
jgi:hypothetical protein